MTEEKTNSDKKKKQIIFTVIAFGIILLISGIMLLMMKSQKAGETVRIVQDGKVLYTLDLTTEKDREIVVECETGKNVIEIKDHKISVKSADCPDKVCVGMGTLKKDYVPIVCYPHKLYIEYVEE